MSFLPCQYSWDYSHEALCAGGREFESLRPAKSYTALQMVCHRFNIYAGSCVALAWCYDVEMGTAKLLHALACNAVSTEYNERFGSVLVDP